jgi:hypothetical protein
MTAVPRSILPLLVAWRTFSCWHFSEVLRCPSHSRYREESGSDAERQTVAKKSQTNTVRTSDADTGLTNPKVRSSKLLRAPTSFKPLEGHIGQVMRMQHTCPAMTGDKFCLADTAPINVRSVD